jgi:DNA polymerase III epsilon subunit-like protein
MARALDKTSPNHKLDTLADRYGIKQLAHHDAGDDSFVGARLALHLLVMPGELAAFERAKLK